MYFMVNCIATLANVMSCTHVMYGNLGNSTWLYGMVHVH